MTRFTSKGLLLINQVVTPSSWYKLEIYGSINPRRDQSPPQIAEFPQQTLTAVCSSWSGKRSSFSGKRRIMNLLCSGSFPLSFPCDLGWQSQCSSSVSSSHYVASLDFWFPPLRFLQFLTFAFATQFAWSLFSLHKFISSQRHRYVLLGLLPSVHPCSPPVCMQPRVHYVILPKLLLTPCSSFLVEFNLLVIGLMGLCEVLDWLLQLLPSFREPSISTIKPTLLPVPIRRKGVPIIQ